MKRFLISVVALALLVMSAHSALAASGFRMKIHSVGSDAHPSTTMLHEFKKYVEENSGGRISVSIHNNAQLGGDRQATEAMQLGTIECGVLPTTTIASFDPRFNIFELPFIFKSHEEAYKHLDGALGEKLKEALLSQGMRIIGYGVNGFRHISNNRGPITKPEDLKGLKIRTQENPIHIAAFKLLGSSPTPMSFSELYTALAQKTVDAQENPITLTYSSKFYEVQEYYSLTGHVYAVAPLVVSTIFFDRLPEDLQKVVLDAGKLYADGERKSTVELEGQMLQELKNHGMKVNELTPEELEVFKKTTLPVYKEFESKIGTDLLNMILKGEEAS